MGTGSWTLVILGGSGSIKRVALASKIGICIDVKMTAEVTVTATTAAIDHFRRHTTFR
jgi:hypothetical protein